MTEYNMKLQGSLGNIPSVNDFMNDVNHFAETQGIFIQMLDADMIFGKEHIVSAFEHAKRSIQQDEASTHSLKMEILLYASGERQIKHAIEKMGVKKGKTVFVTIFLFPEEKKQSIDNIINMFNQKFQIEVDGSALIPKESKLFDYGISKQAIESVRDDQKFQLVLEKIALVDVIK